MNKRILITGGAGFIGSNLANQLVSRNCFVRVLDNLSKQIHGENPENSPLYKSLHPHIEFIHGSVTDSHDLQHSLNGIDTVVHLAAETGTGQSMYEIRRYSDVNIGGTALLMDIIANSSLSVKKVIVASSRAIYGEGKCCCSVHGIVYPNQRILEDMQSGDYELHCPLCNLLVDFLPTDEDSFIKPSSVYGITKLNQEQLVLTVCKALGISAFALRYQNVFGPGQSLTNPYTGILSIFSTRILNGNGINIFEDGKESRDFVYIDDVVKATIKSIKYEPHNITALNIGSGVSTDVLTVAQALSERLHKDVPIQISGQFRVGDIRHNVADLKMVKSILGFEPKTSFKEGLNRFVDWVSREKISVDRYESSLAELRSKGLFK